MSSPSKYSPSYSFTGYQTVNPTLPLPGPRIDEQFNNISQSIGQTVDALADIRRPDGKLQNGTVGPDALSSALTIGFTLRGQWASSISYNAGDGAVYNGVFYAARVQHVSAPSTRPDLAPSTWRFLFTTLDLLIPNFSLGPEKLTLPIYPSRSLAAVENIAPNVNALGVCGHASPGDGGNSIYRRVATQPTHAGKFQSADGTWWERAKRTPYIILATGQSNFVRESDITIAPWNIPDNLFIWNGTPTFAGNAWVSPNPARMNAAWAFAAEYAAKHPDLDVYVIIVASGGQNISHWLPGATFPDMYLGCQNAVAAALANLGRAVIDLLLWWQGESDAAAPATYDGDFETLFTRFRSNSWYLRNTPVGIFGIVSSAIGGSAVYGDMNNRLQRRVAADIDNRMFFNTSSAPASLWADTLHLTGDGYAYVGKMACQNYTSGVHRPAGAYINPEDGSLQHREDISDNKRLYIMNMSAHADARSSLAVVGAGGQWNITAGSVTVGAIGFSGVVGMFLDNPTAFNLRVNGQTKASVDTDGIKTGTSDSDPAINNAVGTRISPTTGISSSAAGAGALNLNRMSSDGAIAAFRRQSVVVGSITVTSTATAYNTSSDAKLKTKKGPLSFEDAKQILNLIVIHNFDWNATGEADIGVFAQELFKIYPKAVSVGGWKHKVTGKLSRSNAKNAVYVPWGVDYSKLMPVVARCVQGLLCK